MKKINQLVKKERILAWCCRLYLLITTLAVLAGIAPQQLVAGTSNTIVQSIMVSGKVKDETGTVLPGVNVIEKGTTNGTVTDSDGNYRLSVSSREAVLVFSFVGIVSQQITVGNQSEFNVQLISDASLLSEVVVVGYGTQEKRDVTGSVASLKSEEFNKGIINSPEQLLQGKVAGLNITSASGEPGSKLSITVRGPGTVRSGTTPLYVVDGMALDNSNTGGDLSPLNFLNPQDIESMDVLKDASATAIYGARGANGVILITTKKGKAGRSSLTYSSSLGISSLARKIPVYSADEFRSKVVEAGGVLDDRGGSTDWQNEITRTGKTQNHNLSFAGGADRLTYYASLGFQDQQGIIKDNDLKRYTGRINVSQKLLNDRLNLDFNLNATNTVSNRPPISDLIGSALTMNPTAPAYDADGNLSVFADVTNPILKFDLYDNITNTNRLIGNISPSFKIIEGLVYKLNFGIDNSNSVRDEQSLPSTITASQQPGRLTSRFNNNNNSLVENYITYTFTKSSHNVTVLAGHSYQKIAVQTRGWSIDKFAENGIEPRYNPGLGQELDLTDNAPYGSATKNELQSFFGRANYEFKDRYLLTATVRVDGSSKFGANNKYGTFPSFAVGWRISEESFMESFPFSNLKLRAGWGQTGNQEIPPKITQAKFVTLVSSSTSYPLTETGTYPPGTIYRRFANPDIQWEVSAQTNVGLDFGLLGGALTGSVDYFNKVSNNILLEVVPPDPIQPALTYWTNVKDMKITNKGLELTLAYQHKGANLTYGFGGNTAFIHNNVEGSPFTVIPSGYATGSGLTSATINGYVNGQPIGTFYMKDFVGIDENGLNIFRDANGDGLDTDQDRISAGSALPTTLYNFYGNVAFKGFDFTANFNGVAGNKIYDNTEQANFYKAKIAKSQNTTSAAMQYPAESIINSASVSTRYLKNGAYLRMNNLTLGYNFSPKSLGIDNWISSLRLSVTGQNLFVITDYTGYDPEVNADRTINDITSYGIDHVSYPKAKTVVFGLNVSF